MLSTQTVCMLFELSRLILSADHARKKLHPRARRSIIVNARIEPHFNIQIDYLAIPGLL